jgi:hypothetical protein
MDFEAGRKMANEIKEGLRDHLCQIGKGHSEELGPDAVAALGELTAKVVLKVV